MAPTVLAKLEQQQVTQVVPLPLVVPLMVPLGRLQVPWLQARSWGPLRARAGCCL